MYIFDILVRTLVAASVFFFGAQLFRFSLKQYWLPLATAAILTAIFNMFTDKIMGWDSVRPLLSLILQTVMIHIILKISKWRSLIVTFLGMITYILALAFIVLLCHFVTGQSFYRIFILNLYGNVNELLTVLILSLLIAMMFRYRLGFTLVSTPRGLRKGPRFKRDFTIVFILSVIVFSVAYYAITIRIYYLLWVAIIFLISLVVLVLFLYNQELEED